MPRRKTTKAEKMALSDRWKTFGLWLRERRMARHFTQRQAAEAVGISKLQWLRYEHGDRVPREKFGKIAKALDIELRRIFYLAGYKTPPTRNDANVLLRQMHNKMLAGDLVGALEQFLLIYGRIRADQAKSDVNIDGVTPTNFANAVIFLDAVPLWLFGRIVTWGLKRLEREKNQKGVKVRFRNLVLNECMDELRRQTPRILDTYPEVNFVGSGLPEKEPGDET
jgi:transcriptional regulator with XRE-family HTH domain